MALTISVIGKGIIANADNLTNDTGGDGTGDWAELGGGAIAETGVSIQGGSGIAGAYSNKDGWQYFDIGAGNELDFGSGGTEENQLVFMWVQMPALAQLDTKANGGLRVRIGSGTTVYKEYVVAGNDDSNGWLGGWKCFAVDITKASTTGFGNGTTDLTSIRYFGIYLNTSSAGRGDNFFMDRIVVGEGIRITGTSTEGWKDTVDYCVATSTVLGMIQEREGLIYAMGKVVIGDATSQTADVSFADAGKIIKFATTEYWNGTAWISLKSASASGVRIEDHTSYKTDFTDGVIVGTDKGRSGSRFIGNENELVFFDLYGGNNSNSKTLCYATTFERIDGAFNSGNDSTHKFLSCNFIKSAQFDPVGAPVIRNCIFAETDDVDSALLWNDNIDIADCQFLANTNGAGIEHASSTNSPFTYTRLYFSGNTNDVLNSSGSAITINKAGAPASDPTSSEGSGVTFSGTIILTVSKLVTLSDVVIYEAGTTTVLDSVDQNVGTTWEYEYTAADTIDIGVFLSGYRPYYIRNLSIGTSDSTIPIAQAVDRDYLE